MIVVAHGKVDDYCASHGMTIGERFVGKIEEYTGGGLIVVTDNCSDKNDYYYLRGIFRKKGIELVSTHWYDPAIEDFLEYKERRDAEGRAKKGGRPLFGTQSDRDMVVVRRIIELRDAGMTMQRISDDPEVRYADGRQISRSTIQVILNNRERYGL